MNLKARLWNLPLVTYDLGFNLAHNQSDSTAFTYRYNVTNGLSLFHQLSPIVSPSARLARQDGVDPDNVSSSTAFSTSLSVTPLPTLTHAFNFSARQDKDRSLTRTAYSLSNANSAELYRGVSVSLSLTGSMTNENTGKEQKDILVATGINLVPHRSLSVNINAAATKSFVSGGTRVESSNDSRTAGISVTTAPASVSTTRANVPGRRPKQMASLPPGRTARPWPRSSRSRSNAISPSSSTATRA
jgi:hypothetical protein